MKIFNVYQFGVKPNSNEEYNNLIGTSGKETKEEAVKEISLSKFGKDRAEFMEGYLTAYEVDVDFEFIEWAEKAVNEAQLIGYDQINRKYEATGIMSTEEIVEIYDIELCVG